LCKCFVVRVVDFVQVSRPFRRNRRRRLRSCRGSKGRTDGNACVDRCVVRTSNHNLRRPNSNVRTFSLYKLAQANIGAPIEITLRNRDVIGMFWCEYSLYWTTVRFCSSSGDDGSSPGATASGSGDSAGSADSGVGDSGDSGSCE